MVMNATRGVDLNKTKPNEYGLDPRCVNTNHDGRVLQKIGTSCLSGEFPQSLCQVDFTHGSGVDSSGGIEQMIRYWRLLHHAGGDGLIALAS